MLIWTMNCKKGDDMGNALTRMISFSITNMFLCKVYDHNGKVTSLSLLNDFVASGSVDKTVFVWNMRSKQKLLELKLRTAEMRNSFLSCQLMF